VQGLLQPRVQNLPRNSIADDAGDAVVRDVGPRLAVTIAPLLKHQRAEKGWVACESKRRVSIEEMYGELPGERWPMVRK